MWSKIALEQLIGRAHRYGQRKTVVVYLMIALETVDVLMTDQAFVKGSMLDSFLGKEQSRSEWSFSGIPEPSNRHVLHL
jgi:SNF2 family DNA or RNA helicase